MLDLMTLYTTQRNPYVCWSGQNNHRVSSQQESGSEMTNLALLRNFVTWDISWLQTVETMRILKNNSGGKMQWAICWSGNPHLHLLRQKSNCSSHIVTQFMDVLFGTIHSKTLLESLLSVIVTHSSVLLTSPDTPARVWQTTDPINLVFRKFAYSLMSRVNSFPQH